MNKRLLLLVPAALILMGASCSVQQNANVQVGNENRSATPAVPANQNQQPATPAQPPVTEGNKPGAFGVITVSTRTDAKLGPILVTSSGMTLYTYAKDTAGVSNCSGTCAANWPAYTVNAGTSLFAGLEVKGLLSTITRADGSLQVTYKGMPLYTYVGDTKPGDTNGQGVGGNWYVAKP